MLTENKTSAMLKNIKDYKKRYLSKNIENLDESGTRIMINNFLTQILCYKELEEIKTEYLIKGTYADYIIQLNGKRIFLVEVKAFSIDLTQNHLRQAINYGANEGIEWALLTNSKQFQLFKIIFGKPIEEKLVFKFDLTDENLNLKSVVENLSFLHKEAITKKSLETLWFRYSALNSDNIASLLLSKEMIDNFKKVLKTKYKTKFTDDEIINSITNVIVNPIIIEKLKK